jgi:hypothetical protein
MKTFPTGTIVTGMAPFCLLSLQIHLYCKSFLMFSLVVRMTWECDA